MRISQNFEFRFAIIGGGISGLATAHFLQKKFGETATIYLFEKSNRFGGWIHTIQKNHFTFDIGPNSLRFV